MMEKPYIFSTDDESVFTVEDGKLIQHPLDADGNWSAADSHVVDWTRGVIPEDEPRLRAIEARLTELSSERLAS